MRKFVVINKNRRKLKMYIKVKNNIYIKCKTVLSE